MTREEVLTLLPEIKLIHSTDLQEKSIICWQQVLELGGWDKKGVDKAPLAAGIVADNCPETGIDHCRRVVRMCQLAYDELASITTTWSAVRISPRATACPTRSCT